MKISKSNGSQPWSLIPNPCGFLSLGELALNHQGTAPAGQSGRRTSRFGRDWLGLGFEKGDIVLSSAGANPDLYTVKEIYLDESDGRPVGEPFETLFILRGTDQVYYMDISEYIRSGHRDQLELQLVDSSWTGALGLYSETSRWTDGRFSLDLIEVRLQESLVKVSPVGGSGRAKSLRQEKLTSIGDHLSDPGLIPLYRSAAAVPLTATSMTVTRNNAGRFAV